MNEEGNKKANGLIQEARALIKKADWEGAFNRFQQALAQDPGSVEAAKGLAHILQLAGRREEGDHFTRLALSLSKEPDAPLLTQMADLALRDGDLDTAIHALISTGSLFFKKGYSFSNPKASNPVLFITLATLLWEKGRHDDAIKIFSIIYKIKLATIEHISKTRNLPMRALFLFFGGSIIRGIGDFCTPTDILVKAAKLGMIPDIEYCFLLDERVKTNRTLIDYFGKYINVVKDKAKIKELRSIYEHCELPSNFVPGGELGGFHWYEAWHEVNRRWYELGNPPLLTLEEQHREEGWKTLESLGVPKDAWFVCLHVRESGYHQDEGSTFADSRGAEIADYMDSIAEIIKRGGWVIRVGDASMTPLEPMENFIDYATGPAKSERMDIFLCAACRFFVGTNSGLGVVPLSFGVPTIQTNMLPVSFFTTLAPDLFIHKTIHRKEGGAPLSMREMYDPPYLNIHSAKVLEGLGVVLKDNSPEEISGVVVEMMDRLDGKPDEEEDNVLVERFFEASAFCGQHSHGRPGVLFVRNNKHLI